MKERKIDVRNLVSTRGVLGLALLGTYSPTDQWWQKAILVVAVAYLWVTAAMGRRD
jgi:hypothetical protein